MTSWLPAEAHVKPLVNSMVPCAQQFVSLLRAVSEVQREGEPETFYSSVSQGIPSPLNKYRFGTNRTPAPVIAPPRGWFRSGEQNQLGPCPCGANSMVSKADTEHTITQMCVKSWL